MATSAEDSYNDPASESTSRSDGPAVSGRRPAGGPPPTTADDARQVPINRQLSDSASEDGVRGSGENQTWNSDSHSNSDEHSNGTPQWCSSMSENAGEHGGQSMSMSGSYSMSAKGAVVVISPEEELRSAVSWALQLMGCKNVELYGTIDDNVVNAVAEKSADDLVLCDLVLSQTLLDRLQILRSGTDESKNASVVMLCERTSDRQHIGRCLEAGADSFIMKPLRIQSIRAAVTRYICSNQEQVNLKEAAEFDAGEDHVRGGQAEAMHYVGRFLKERSIGRGTAGEVWLVKRRRDGAKFALKEINLNRMNFREQQRILNEMRLHGSLCCPCVVRFYRCWVEDDTAYLLMEYVQSGSLHEQVAKHKKENTRIPDATIIDWGAQIVLALMYIHNHSVLHRDLKLENILGPDAEGCVKLSDFGIARQIRRKSADKVEPSFVGSPITMAPERCGSLFEEGDGRESDLWSLGVCLYELATLRPPFVQDDEDISKLGMQGSNIFDRISSAAIEPLPYPCDSVLHKLITGGLLQKNARDRPTVFQLCKDPTLGGAMLLFLKRRKLMDHPAVIEIIDVLPSKGKNRSPIVCGSLDLVSTYEKSLALEASGLPSVTATSRALRHARMQGLKEQARSARAVEQSQLASTSLTSNSLQASDKPANTLSALPEDSVDLKEAFENEITVMDKNLEHQLTQSKTTIKQLRADLAAVKSELAFMQRPVESAQRQATLLDEIIHKRGVIRSRSLRFRDSNLEAGFTGKRKNRLVARTSAAAALMSLVCLVTLWIESIMSGHALKASAKQGVVSVFILGPVICLIGLIVFFTGLSAIIQEVSSTMLSFLIIFLVILLDPVYSNALLEPDLLERPATDVSRHRDFTWPLLSLVLALGPSALPSRWCIQLVSQCFLVLFCFYTEFIAQRIEMESSSNSDWLWTFIVRVFLLFLLGFGSILERRHAEYGERLQFILSSNINPSYYGNYGINGSDDVDKSSSRQGALKRQLSRQQSRLSNNSARQAFGKNRQRSPSHTSLTSKTSVTTKKMMMKIKTVSFGNLKAQLLRANSAASVATTKTEQLFKAYEEADSEVLRAESLQCIAEHGSKERWILETEAVRITEETLGAGGFGVVLEGEFYGTPIAVKLPKGTSSDDFGDLSVGGSQRTRNMLGNELRVLRHVWHPNIVMFYGCTIDPGSREIMLCLELLKGDQLDKFVRRSKDPPTTERRHNLIIDISGALRYLHSRKPCVVHGDLKGSNILVEYWFSGPRPKLLDFGLSRLLTKHVSPLGGTVRWMAPEVVRDRAGAPEPSADVFSFGRLTFLIVTGRPPLHHMTCEQIVNAVQNQEVPTLKWPRKEMPMTSSMKPLVERCLSLQAYARPQMLEIYEYTKNSQSESMDRNPPERQQSFHSFASSNAQVPSRPHGRCVLWEEGIRDLQATRPENSVKGWASFKHAQGWLQSLGIGRQAPSSEDIEDTFLQIMRDAKEMARLIDTSRIQVMSRRVLGVGSRGTIVAAAELDGSLTVLRVPLAPLHVTGAQLPFVLMDLQVLLHVKHPNIAAFHGLCFDPPQHLIIPVLEWVEGAPLQKFVEPQKESKSPNLNGHVTPPNEQTCEESGVDTKTRQRLLIDICSALWYLHGQHPPVVHGRLHGSNILVEGRVSGPRAKIVDVGFSRLLAQNVRRRPAKSKSEAAERRRHELCWSAPELLQQRSLAGASAPTPLPSADVFSVGRLSFMVLTGQVAFKDMDLPSLERLVHKMEDVRLTWPMGGDPVMAKCRRLAERCLSINPLLRPEIDEVQNDVRAWLSPSSAPAPTSRPVLKKGPSHITVDSVGTVHTDALEEEVESQRHKVRTVSTPAVGMPSGGFRGFRTCATGISTGGISNGVVSNVTADSDHPLETSCADLDQPLEKSSAALDQRLEELCFEVPQEHTPERPIDFRSLARGVVTSA